MEVDGEPISKECFPIDCPQLPQVLSKNTGGEKLRVTVWFSRKCFDSLRGLLWSDPISGTRIRSQDGRQKVFCSKIQQEQPY